MGNCPRSTSGLHFPAMRCPYCQVDNDHVLDSRSAQDGYIVRRRRECLGCKRRFTTYERFEQVELKVVKKDGIREPFDAEKLRLGLSKACWKRRISDDQIESIVSGVQQEISASCDNEVESNHLGEIVMNQLRQLDQVAYVRFASVYRQFEDVHDFVDELKPMLSDPKQPPR